jgi:predicted dehydrogenase
MAASYRVVVVGMGKRGMHHASAFFKNPRFELAGICDIDQKRLDDAAPKLGGRRRARTRRRWRRRCRPMCSASVLSRTFGCR